MARLSWCATLLAVAAAVSCAVAQPAWPQSLHDAQGTGLLNSPIQPQPAHPLPLTNLSVIQFEAQLPVDLALTAEGYVIGVGEAPSNFQQAVIYAANLFNPKQPVLWLNQNLSFVGPVSTTSPVIGSKYIYVSMADGSGGSSSDCCESVLAIDPKDGQVVWDSQKTYQAQTMVRHPTLNKDATILYTLTQSSTLYEPFGAFDVLLALDPDTGSVLFNVTLTNLTTTACEDNSGWNSMILGDTGHVFLSCGPGLIHLMTPSEAAIDAAIADALSSDPSLTSASIDRRKFAAPVFTWFRHGNPETSPQGPYYDNATQPWTISGTPVLSLDETFVYVPSQKWFRLDGDPCYLPGLASFEAENGTLWYNYIPTIEIDGGSLYGGPVTVSPLGLVLTCTDIQDQGGCKGQFGLVAYSEDLQTRVWEYCLQNDQNPSQSVQPNFFRNGDVLIAEQQVLGSQIVPVFTRLNGKTGAVVFSKPVSYALNPATSFSIDMFDTVYWISGQQQGVALQGMTMTTSAIEEADADDRSGTVPAIAME